MDDDKRKRLADKGWLIGNAYEFVNEVLPIPYADASANLNASIEQALAPFHSRPVHHDMLSDATDAAQQVEARMRSGAFGGYFVDHDLKIGYDVFGSLTWRLTGKF